MDLSRYGRIGAAIALAVIGTLGLTVYVNNAKNDAVAGEGAVTVFVADAKIPAGTPADKLASLTKEEKVPAKVRPEDAVTNLDDVADLVTSIDLAPGEQLLKSRFISADLQSAQVQSSVAVPKGFFQATVSLEPAQALGGRVRAGNRVAVVWADENSAAGTEDSPQSVVIARNVLVTTVQIDGDNGQAKGDAEQVLNAPTGKFLVTLAVDAEGLQNVVAATTRGSIYIAADPGAR